jgi:hypothetical protein
MKNIRYLRDHGDLCVRTPNRGEQISHKGHEGHKAKLDPENLSYRARRCRGLPSYRTPRPLRSADR